MSTSRQGHSLTMGIDSHILEIQNKSPQTTGPIVAEFRIELLGA